MSKEIKALDAKFEAQKLAFGPIYFHCIVAMRELGILESIRKNRKKATVAQIQEETGVSEYGIRVLCEAGAAANVVEYIDNDTIAITKVGTFVLMDELTRVNINFVKDICYDGAAFTKESITKSSPEGLKTLGDWPTVYEGLKDLTPKQKTSWFEFDHYYSDDAFPFALDIIFNDNPRHIYDIGANTGKWTLACKKHKNDVAITLLDLPGQLKVAEKNVEEAGLSDKVNYHAIDLLDPMQEIPKGADAVWMSQFLDCFSKAEILQILLNVNQAIDANANVFIMEPFIDNQDYPAAEYSLTATSLYFTTIANGNSKMYAVHEMKQLVEKAGMEVVEEFPLIGDSFHTILKCKKKK